MEDEDFEKSRQRAESVFNVAAILVAIAFGVAIGLMFA